MSKISPNLHGQVALVTGGGRGLGRAFALALASAGAAVAITSRTESELNEVVDLIRKAGGRALAVPADVSRPHSVTGLVKTVQEGLGSINLLVNNAGVLRAGGAVAEVEEDAWWREIETNLRGPFLCMQAVLPGMIAERRGRIINLSSSAGLIPIPNATAYCVGKAALIRLSETVALEYQAAGISVFAIDPGTVRTPMTDHFMKSEMFGQRVPEVQARMRKLFANSNDTPIEQSVELVLHLASGKADVLSGCMLSIHDDIAELVRRAHEVEKAGLYRLRLYTVQ